MQQTLASLLLHRLWTSPALPPTANENALRSKSLLIAFVSHLGLAHVNKTVPCEPPA